MAAGGAVGSAASTRPSSQGSVHSATRVPVRSARSPSERSSTQSDVRVADEEMERHIQRVHQKKLAAGTKPEEIERELGFPASTAPSKRLSPRQAEVIYGNHLCPYEAQEMYQYESIYYVGSFARHKHYACLLYTSDAADE